jgi:hypothetical protein
MELPPEPRRDAVSVTATNIVVDTVTGEVVTALRNAGIRSILLRGPALADRLYGPHHLRLYVDVDLLVDPSELAAAEELLARLGFVESALEAAFPEERPGHAHTWVGRRGGVCVDLHRTVIGAGAEPGTLWEILAGRTEPMAVGGSEAEVLDEAGSAFVVALHAAHHGPGQHQQLADLTRALERFPPDTWRRAAGLAARLDATPALAAGLRLVPAGERVATELELPRLPPRRDSLKGGQAFHVAQGLAWAAARPGLRAKAAFLARKIAPPPAAMRASSSLARRGRLGLGAAYARRALSLLRHVPRALRAWRRARDG